VRRKFRRLPAQIIILQTESEDVTPKCSVIKLCSRTGSFSHAWRNDLKFSIIIFARKRLKHMHMDAKTENLVELQHTMCNWIKCFSYFHRFSRQINAQHYRAGLLNNFMTNSPGEETKGHEMQFSILFDSRVKSIDGNDENGARMHSFHT
jgi:uncharacterized protein (DUF927 family)